MKLNNPYNLNTHLLNDGDNFRVGWSQDCSGAIERNRIIREAQQSRRFASDTEHLASIPTIIYEKWMRELGLSWPPTQDDLKVVLSKVQNDPEFKHFRTGTKR